MDIITFGSATWDIFLKVGKNHLVMDKRFPSGSGVCFGLGSKIDIGDMYFSFGGGGVNAAFTFKKQGFDVAYCGSIGNDIPGKEIIAELKRMGIETSFIQKDGRPTNNSVIFNASKEERTVLAYRGASELLNKKDIDWKRMNASWFYLAPLSGKLRNITEDIVDFSKKNNIKVAINLGNSQIALGEKKLQKILKKVDILLLNQEEASLLTGVEFKEEVEIMKELDRVHPGINAVTRGGRGVLVADGEYIYDATSPKTKVIDKTGAGDAFGSGFVSGLIKSKNDIDWSIRLGTSNAIACMQVKGIEGLLDQSDDFMKIGRKIKIKKTKLL